MSSEPLALVGESAGGNLCLTLILRAFQLGIRLPQAAAFLSPWCEPVVGTLKGWHNFTALNALSANTL